MKIQSLEDLNKIRQEYEKQLYAPAGVKVNIGMASCGIAAGAQAAMEKAVDAYKDKPEVEIRQTGCIGFCEQEPLVEMMAPGKPRIMYQNITEDKIVDAIEGYMAGEYNKKWILGQMKDPRSLMDDDIKNPQDAVTPAEGIPFMEELVLQ
ncbi:MAG: (2Fe-2S) ferredoxin domain-containing protein [Desulfobacterales bacterium]